MKPKNPTPDEAKKIACDTILERAAVMMVAEVGASIPMMIDSADVLRRAGRNLGRVGGNSRAFPALRRSDRRWLVLVAYWREQAGRREAELTTVAGMVS